MKKTLLKCFLPIFILIIGLTFSLGCGGQSKEEVVYKVICKVADAYDEDLSDIRVISGTIKQEEDEFTIWLKVNINGSYTRYYLGHYNSKTNELDYNDNTYIISVSAFVGPNYTATDSFDIVKVNRMLLGN